MIAPLQDVSEPVGLDSPGRLKIDRIPRMPHTLGTFIRERRRELGLTQEQLADRVGGRTRQSEISRLERNLIMLPRRERLAALAAALEITPGDLLVRSGWIAPDDPGRVVFTASAPAPPTDLIPPGADAPGLTAIVDTVNQLQETVIMLEHRLQEVRQSLAEVRQVLDLEQTTDDAIPS